MARNNNLIPNFTGGEISPRSAARRDLEGYYNSTEYQVNFISDLQGGARFRPGSRLGTEATGFRLIPFVYDALDNYFVEIGKWVRIISPDGRPKVSGASGTNTWTVEEVEKRTDQIVYHVSGVDYTNLTTSNLFTIFGISPELDDEFKVYADGYLDDDRIAAINTSSINASWREVVVESTGATASASVAPAQAMTLIQNEAFLANYTSAEAQRLQFAQKFDEMWLTCGTKPAKKLKRTAPSPGQILFTFADADIHKDGSSTDLAELTTASNYPYCVTLYEDRLWYAHTDKNPGTLWGSETQTAPGNGFTRFDDPGSPIIDTDSIRLTINGSGGDINFILPDKDLLYLGCLDGAFGVDSGSSSLAITANAFRFRPLHIVGTALGRPYFQFESDLYFVDRGGTGMWRVVYNFNTEKFEPELITLASDHLTKAGIVYAAVKNGDDGRIFLNLFGGSVLANTISRIYGAKAFSRLDPGLSDAKVSQYSFTNICSLPSSSSQDIIGAVVQAAGSGRKVIVTFASDISSQTTSLDAIRSLYADNEVEAKNIYNGFSYAKIQGTQPPLDVVSSGFDVRAADLTLSAVSGAGVTVTASGSVFVAGDVGKRILVSTAPSLVRPYLGAGVALITGYSSATSVTVTVEETFKSTEIGAGFWLVSTPKDTILNLTSFFYANYYVDISVDGILYENILVGDDLEVSMPAEGYFYHIGFKYPGIIKTVNMAGAGQFGTSEGLPKNLYKMRVNFFEAGPGTSYGTDFYRLENLDFSQLDDFTDRPPPLFTGEKEIRFDENWKEEKHIYIRHSGGTPCTVLSLIPFFNTSMD